MGIQVVSAKIQWFFKTESRPGLQFRSDSFTEGWQLELRPTSDTWVFPILRRPAPETLLTEIVGNLPKSITPRISLASLASCYQQWRTGLKSGYPWILLQWSSKLNDYFNVNHCGNMMNRVAIEVAAPLGTKFGDCSSPRHPKRRALWRCASGVGWHQPYNLKLLNSQLCCELNVHPIRRAGRCYSFWIKS